MDRNSDKTTQMTRLIRGLRDAAKETSRINLLKKVQMQESQMLNKDIVSNDLLTIEHELFGLQQTLDVKFNQREISTVEPGSVLS